MSLGTDLYTALQALAGGRVYPVLAPPTCAAPYLVWQVIAGEPDYHARGASGLQRTRVQVDAWADTYAAAQALIASATTALRGSANWAVAAEYVNPDDVDPETGHHRASTDYVLWHD